MESKDCPMCHDLKKGKRWTEAVALGTKSVKEASVAFEMTRTDVEEHVYKHANQNIDTPKQEELFNKEFYIKRLDSMSTDLHRLLDEALDDSDTSIRDIATLTREIRDTLRLLGETTKVLRDDEAAATEQALQDMRANYLVMTNIIMTCVCPECKKRILSEIAMQKALLTGEVNDTSKSETASR